MCSGIRKCHLTVPDRPILSKNCYLTIFVDDSVLNITFCSLTQVTIEVVDGLEGHEPEKGLRKESKPNWASPNWRNWWPHSSSSSSSTTHQTEEHDRSYGSNSEDSNFLRPPADWDRRGGTGGGGKAQTEYGERDRRACLRGNKCTMHIAEYLAGSIGSYLSTGLQRFHRWP